MITPIRPDLKDCSRIQQASSLPLLLTDSFVPHLQVANYVVASIMHATVPGLLIRPYTEGSIHIPQASQLSSGYGLLLPPLRRALSAMSAQLPEPGGGPVGLLAPAGVCSPAMTLPPDRYTSTNCIAALLQNVSL
jgi:hypothetical protein